MRTKLLVLVFALLLAPAGLVLGQGQEQGQTASGQSSAPPSGQSATQAAAPAAHSGADVSEESPLTIDAGFRVAGVSGDRARFERYQDLRSGGVNLNLFGKKAGPSWFAD